MNNYLKHFGILGMKWGHRRLSSRNQGMKARRQLMDLRANRRIHTFGKKKIWRLSDKEATDLMNQVDMKEKYAKLRSDRLKAGAIMAAGIIALIGLNAISSHVPAAKGIKVPKGTVFNP